MLRAQSKQIRSFSRTLQVRGFFGLNKEAFFGAAAPKGFKNFYPEKDSDEPESDPKKPSDSNSGKTNSNNKKEKSSEKTESTESKVKDIPSFFKFEYTFGNGKKGKNSNNNDDDQRSNIGISLLLSTFVLFLLFRESRHGKEISWQEFQTQLLESGQVDRLIVANKSIARVMVRQTPAGKREGEELVTDTEGRMVRANASTTPDNSQFGYRPETTDSKPARYPTLGVTPGSYSKYYFSIGSVDTFERRLEDAQKSLGIPPQDYVPVMYTSETDYLHEIVKFVPTMLLFGGAFFLIRRMGGASGGGGGGGLGSIFKIGKSPAKRISKEMITTRFADVAGCDEAKKEVMEFVEFLKDSKKFTDLGAKIPKGALLCGPPGTGKTLLARATAGEANVPFFSISGSDFLEMFVGVGPARVRDLFKEARESAPCIIFIDEIDAVGRQRGKGMGGGGNDERENTLNQLLVEMDGFDASTNVVVLAGKYFYIKNIIQFLFIILFIILIQIYLILLQCIGTNRIDILDSALTRPGRFDRKIMVDKPDIGGRKSIFEVHLRSIVLDGDKGEFASRLAALTPGFTGADIANICNEAAINAGRTSKKKVDLGDFEVATDRVIAGLESKKVMSAEEKRIVAYHEAGHAVAGWNLEHADPLLKVTIVPRSSGSLGFAQYLPKEIFLRSKEQILDMVTMALAGRAAEQVVFGRVTTGASDDLRRVTGILYQMVQIYGMNDKVGQLAFPKEEGQWPAERLYSDATAQMIDSEVRILVEDAYKRTLALIESKRDQVELVAQCLLEKETITNADVIRLIGPRPFKGSKEYDEYLSAGGSAWTGIKAPIEDAGKDTEKSKIKPSDSSEKDEDDATPILAPL